MITPRRFDFLVEIWHLVGREPFLWSSIKDHVTEPKGEFMKLQTNKLVIDCGFGYSKSSTRKWVLNDWVIELLTKRVGEPRCITEGAAA